MMIFLLDYIFCYVPDSILENKNIKDDIQMGRFCNIIVIKDNQEENGMMIIICNVIYQKNKMEF